MQPTPFKLPTTNFLTRALESLVQCTALRRARRRVLQTLPWVTLRSDVSNVLYLNWLVPVERVQHLAPPNVTLWTRDGMTVLTVLTYRHGHFGPTFLGPLRRIMPSPLQSNWRLYVDAIDGEAVEEPTVLFLVTMADSTLCAVGTRLLSDALPLHRTAAFVHDQKDARTRTFMHPGSGSAADLTIEVVRTAPNLPMPQAWSTAFASDMEALKFLCWQDRAVVPVEDLPGVLAEGTIKLPIDVTAIVPLDMVPGSFHSDWLSPLVEETLPWCFEVPKVVFTVVGERLLYGKTN